MLTRILCPIMIAMVVVGLTGCGDKPAPVAAKSTAKDPKRVAMEERINKTTPEGKQIIEKVKAMKPEVNKQLSTKTIAEMVEVYSKNSDQNNLSPIGWEAAQKKPYEKESVGRWKVAFDYQDWQKQYMTAEWEYNPITNSVYPFELDNAKGFWSNEGANTQATKGKK